VNQVKANKILAKVQQYGAGKARKNATKNAEAAMCIVIKKLYAIYLKECQLNTHINIRFPN